MKKEKGGILLKKNSLVNVLFFLLTLTGVAFYYSSKNDFIHAEIGLAALLAVTLCLYLFIRKSYISPLKGLKKEIKVTESKGKDELQMLVEAHHSMQENINAATEFVREIEKGNLEGTYTAAENDDLGTSLLSMREYLKEISAQEKERIWTSEGLAKFSELLRTNEADINGLCFNVLSHLIKYIKANQGALFVIQEKDSTEEYMEMVACYAYDRKKFLEKKIYKGEGLAGQAWIENDTLYLTDVPQDYVAINSGLGNANPSCILIVPLKVNEEIYGVLELASFAVIPTYQVEFIEKLAENLASTISMVKVNERTRNLLEESQELTEQMRAQEEEMRQNLEELTATQEELQRKEGELDKKLKAALKEIELGRINQQMNEIALQIEHTIDSTGRDLKFLSNVPPVQGLVRAIANNNFDAQSNSSYEDWIERMDTIFRNFLVNKELFQSITFTRENGSIIYQIYFDGSELVRNEKGKLDEQAQNIFIHASGLQKGEVYVGQIKTIPGNVLVMEFGIPVFDERRVLKGTILVHLYVETIINGIKSKEDGDHKYSLFSSDGVCIFGNALRTNGVEGMKKQVLLNPKQNFGLTIVHQ